MGIWRIRKRLGSRRRRRRSTRCASGSGDEAVVKGRKVAGPVGGSSRFGPALPEGFLIRFSPANHRLAGVFPMRVTVVRMNPGANKAGIARRIG